MNTVNERFDEKVYIDTTPNGCHLWTASTRSGYGAFDVDGKTVSAHRYSLERSVGPAPKDKPQAIHACRNRHCVNPQHLKWGSPLENMLDRNRDGTSNHGHTNAQGEKCGTAKLKEGDVHQIRRLLSQGYSQRETAEFYDVHNTTISQIKLGTTWGHI